MTTKDLEKRRRRAYIQVELGLIQTLTADDSPSAGMWINACLSTIHRLLKEEYDEADKKKVAMNDA